MYYDYPQSRPRRAVSREYAPFQVRRYGRHWEVRDPVGELVCLTVYRRGAAEVMRRLQLATAAVQVHDQNSSSQQTIDR